MADGADEPAAPRGPFVSRRWLGLELVRMRSAAKLKQRDVAKALGCSVGRISYIEGGERSPSVQELRDVLLPLLHVPGANWRKYLAAAEAAEERGWWDDWDQESLPRELRRYVGLEDAAQRMQSYQSSAIPGLLQTPDYAKAVMRSHVTLAEFQIARQVDLRRARQGVLTRERDPLEAHFVLHEGALRTEVGGAETLRVQLRHIADLAEYRPNVDLRVVPFSAGGHGGFTGPFFILGFGLSHDPGVVFVETLARLTFMESPSDVLLYIQAFDQLVDLALSPTESIEMVRSLASGGLS